MGNIKPGINGLTAGRNFNISELGLTSEDVTIIKRIDPASSFIPNSDFNSLTDVKEGEVLIFVSKREGDLPEYFSPPSMKSYPVESFGVRASNSAILNRNNLQTAIDKVALSASKIRELYFSDRYKIASGIIQRDEVSLDGNFQGMKGSKYAACIQVVDDDDHMIKTCNVNTIRGILFDYPNQNLLSTNPAADLIHYPATIGVSESGCTQITIERCSMVGGSSFIDFPASQDLQLRTLYGYPLHGALVKLKLCYDIAYSSVWHVNPGAGLPYRLLSPDGLPHSREVMEYVIANAGPTYNFEKIDELTISKIFAFGVKKAVKLLNCYGDIVQGKFDQVECMAEVTMNEPNSDYKVMKFMGGSGYNSAGVVANRNSFILNGTGGELQVDSFAFQLGDNPVLTSDNNQNANAAFLLNGTGPQKLKLLNCSGRGLDLPGRYTYDVRKLNNQCVVEATQSQIGIATNKYITNPSFIG